MKGTTKSNGQKDSLDRFYTSPVAVQECLNKLDLSQYDTIIEPSAGRGAFSSQIPHCIAYDVDPQACDIIQQDFLSLSYSRDITKKILVIGNPPYGQQCKLAIAFFNKAAEFADTIAFILPKSFRKDSIQNRLSLNFQLQQDFDIQNTLFTLPSDEQIDVPCIFQIWQYSVAPRVKKKPKTTTFLFSFTTPESADFRIQRVGGNAGKASFDLSKSPSSNYFVKNTSNFSNEELVDIINNTVFDSITNTVGPKSLSKGELIETLETKFDK